MSVDNNLAVNNPPLTIPQMKDKMRRLIVDKQVYDTAHTIFRYAAIISLIAIAPAFIHIGTVAGIIAVIAALAAMHLSHSPRDKAINTNVEMQSLFNQAVRQDVIIDGTFWKEFCHLGLVFDLTHVNPGTDSHAFIEWMVKKGGLQDLHPNLKNKLEQFLKDHPVKSHISHDNLIMYQAQFNAVNQVYKAEISNDPLTFVNEESVDRNNRACNTILNNLTQNDPNVVTYQSIISIVKMGNFSGIEIGRFNQNKTLNDLLQHPKENNVSSASIFSSEREQPIQSLIDAIS